MPCSTVIWPHRSSQAVTRGSNPVGSAVLRSGVFSSSLRRRNVAQCIPLGLPIRYGLSSFERILLAPLPLHLRLILRRVRKAHALVSVGTECVERGGPTSRSVAE